MSSEYNFDNLLFEEVPVTYQDTKYTLREADGQASKLYRNKALTCIKYNEKTGVRETKDLGDLVPYLVHLCLYDTEGKRVPEATIMKWPSRIVQKLYDKAKQISHLDEADPNRQRLLKALEDKSAPVSKQSLLDWAEGLEDSDEDMKNLKTWLLNDNEARVKN